MKYTRPHSHLMIIHCHCWMHHLHNSTLHEWHVITIVIDLLMPPLSSSSYKCKDNAFAIIVAFRVVSTLFVLCVVYITSSHISISFLQFAITLQTDTNIIIPPPLITQHQYKIIIIHSSLSVIVERALSNVHRPTCIVQRASLNEHTTINCLPLVQQPWYRRCYQCNNTFVVTFTTQVKIKCRPSNVRHTMCMIDPRSVD